MRFVGESCFRFIFGAVGASVFALFEFQRAKLATRCARPTALFYVQSRPGRRSTFNIHLKWTVRYEMKILFIRFAKELKNPCLTFANTEKLNPFASMDHGSCCDAALDCSRIVEWMKGVPVVDRMLGNARPPSTDANFIAGQLRISKWMFKTTMATTHFSSCRRPDILHPNSTDILSSGRNVFDSLLVACTCTTVLLDKPMHWRVLFPGAKRISYGFQHKALWDSSVYTSRSNFGRNAGGTHACRIRHSCARVC